MKVLRVKNHHTQSILKDAKIVRDVTEAGVEVKVLDGHPSFDNILEVIRIHRENWFQNTDLNQKVKGANASAMKDVAKQLVFRQTKKVADERNQQLTEFESKKRSKFLIKTQKLQKKQKNQER